MHKWTKIFLIPILFQVKFAHGAEDAKQTVLGLPTEAFIFDDTAESLPASPLIPQKDLPINKTLQNSAGETLQNQQNKINDVFLTDVKEEVRLKSPEHLSVSTDLNQDRQLLSYQSPRSIVRSITPLKKQSFSIKYLPMEQEFNYRDDKGVRFGNIYNNTSLSPSGKVPINYQGGFLLLGYKRYFSEAFLRFFWGLETGAGLSYSESRYVRTGELTGKVNRLWSLPGDLTLGAEITLKSYLALFGSLGGSGLLLWENRSDVPTGDQKKDRRLLGYGYSANAGLRLYLGHIMPLTQRNLFFTSDMTGCSLDILLRYHQYQGFKSSDLYVTGTSYGMGLSFDFL